MNKKGFTLVELLAVIVILSIIIVIVATNGFGAFNKTKKKITEENIRAIEESANVLATQIDNCDDNLDSELWATGGLAEKNGISSKGCSSLKEKILTSNGCLKVKVSYLIEKKYLSDNKDYDSLKDRTIEICKDNDKITINMSNIKSNTGEDGSDNSFSKVITDNKTNGTNFKENLKINDIVEGTTEAEEKIISTAEDDYGTSYYYRGNVEDNYLSFAGMCFRIVRIEGDGSIKLILASELECSETNLTSDSGYATDGAKGVKGTILTANYGYKMFDVYFINDYINSTDDTTENARKKLNEWLERKITNESDLALLKNDIWCIGDQTNAYGWTELNEKVGEAIDLLYNNVEFYFISGNKYYANQKNVSYKCITTGVDGETIISKVGLLTYDEVVFAGGRNGENSNYYLNNNAKTKWWWTLSPMGLDANLHGVGSFAVSYNGSLDYKGVFDSDDNALRPSITLKNSVKIKSGDGTINNPYKVEEK